MPTNEQGFYYPAINTLVPWPTAGSPQNLAASGSIADVNNYVQSLLLQGLITRYDPFGGTGNGTTGSAAQQSLIGISVNGAFVGAAHYLNFTGSSASAGVNGEQIDIGLETGVNVYDDGVFVAATSRIDFAGATQVGIIPGQTIQVTPAVTIQQDGAFQTEAWVLNLSGSNSRIASTIGGTVDIGFNPNITVTVTGSTPSGVGSNSAINLTNDFSLSQSAGKFEVGNTLKAHYGLRTASGTITIPATANSLFTGSIAATTNGGVTDEQNGWGITREGTYKVTSIISFRPTSGLADTTVTMGMLINSVSAGLTMPTDAPVAAKNANGDYVTVFNTNSGSIIQPTLSANSLQNFVITRYTFLLERLGSRR